MVTGFGPSSTFFVFIPDFVVIDKSHIIKKDGEVAPLDGASFTSFPEFELPDNKWVAYDHGSIIRFPKDKEWEWRSKKALDIVKIISTNPSTYANPEQRMCALESSAHLCGFSLVDLVQRLEEARKGSESLDDVFKRIKNERSEI